MALTRFYPAAIGSKASLRHMELGRQIGDDIMRSRTHLHGTEAQITHGAKLKGNAETSGI
jgi:hypothetical protein